MRKYAKIGKAVLARALGLQKNYTEEIESRREVTDEVASGCTTCKWKDVSSVAKEGTALYEEQVSNCASCKTKQTKMECTYKKVYRNEKNQYGYLPRLKTHAIKLFLAYHMLEADDNGFVRNVSIKELATLLGCNVKTIKNNNRILMEYGYIHFSNVTADTINIYLPEFASYFEPAGSGGRGFLVLSEDVFSAIVETRSLNPIRLSLRQLMEFDILNNQGFTVQEKTYKELKRTLPDYCKPNVIRKVASLLNMFEVTINASSLRLAIKDEYNAKKVKKAEKAHYEEDLAQFFCELTNHVSAINTLVMDKNESQYASFFASNPFDGFKLFPYRPGDLADLAGLCVEYSKQIVIDALSLVYREYILREGKKVRLLGALTRSYIQHRYGQLA
ncbi:hypothetical protein [Anaerobium acetethylicum]|uniref:Uncharacterized protein n=1 Tax=Anaerobium acetethylicum TaxID=1619234 RepID=A0A1D3TXR9_9FIRM|nr:hypothetical protein [Anaerobium acetethylicum]SCP99142.1 hypothetical protein SAMN05421730_103312 [Anaerobium acetethylicum]